MTDASELVSRRAARVLLLDPSDRVLLMHGCDPARRDYAYWFTVGGGLDPDETLLAGAVREVFEETGLRLTPEDLRGPVWHETTRFRFDGVEYSQEQDFFVARVEPFDVDLSHLDEYERNTVDAWRWWSAEELERTEEVFYPRDLPLLLRGEVS